MVQRREENDTVLTTLVFASPNCGGNQTGKPAGSVGIPQGVKEGRGRPARKGKANTSVSLLFQSLNYNKQTLQKRI